MYQRRQSGRFSATMLWKSFFLFSTYHPTTANSDTGHGIHVQLTASVQNSPENATKRVVGDEWKNFRKEKKFEPSSFPLLLSSEKPTHLLECSSFKQHSISFPVTISNMHRIVQLPQVQSARISHSDTYNYWLEFALMSIYSPADLPKTHALVRWGNECA